MSKTNNLVFIKPGLLIAVISLVLTGCTTISRFFALEQTQAPIQNISTKITYYKVQQGDSLYDLSRRFNVTERTLILWNHLQAPYLLSPGQTIRVSPLPGEKIWRADEEAELPSTMSSSIKPSNQAQDFSNNISNSREPIVDPSAAPASQKTAATSLPPKTSHLDTTTPPQVSDSHKHQTDDDTKIANPRPQFYVIKAEDSLLGIANRFDVSFSELKAWNNIDDPNLIYVGQKILLNPPDRLPNKTNASLAEPSQTTPSKKLSSEQNMPTKHSTINAAEKTDQQQKKQSSQKLPMGKTVNNIQWAWPLHQRGEFTANSLDKDHVITVTEGTEVLAAASGDVIYAGIATNGVGKMVIINHTNDYISAYSHLQTLSVKEADKLELGQPLGKVGKFNDQSELNFEIRQNGQIKEISQFYHLKPTVS